MTVLIHFETENASFDFAEQTLVNEAIAWQIREIADKIESGESDYGNIIDLNGNTIGHWENNDYKTFVRR